MGQLDEQKPRKESCFETAVKYTKIQKDMLMTYLQKLKCSKTRASSKDDARVN